MSGGTSPTNWLLIPLLIFYFHDIVHCRYIYKLYYIMERFFTSREMPKKSLPSTLYRPMKDCFPQLCRLFRPVLSNFILCFCRRTELSNHSKVPFHFIHYCFLSRRRKSHLLHDSFLYTHIPILFLPDEAWSIDARVHGS